jgi:hypothetical protein
MAPRYLIGDRDGAYGEVFIRRLRSMGIRDRPTSPHSPWQNGYAERLIGSRSASSQIKVPEGIFGHSRRQSTSFEKPAGCVRTQPSQKRCLRKKICKQPQKSCSFSRKSGGETMTVNPSDLLEAYRTSFSLFAIEFSLARRLMTVAQLPRLGGAFRNGLDNRVDVQAGFFAKCIPSANGSTRPAMQIWFTVLVSCPDPAVPNRLHILE